MKKFLFIITFLFFLKPVVPLLDYAINYEYITTELCENKDKPVMACNGKCHLMKELAKSSEKETPISSNKNNSIKEIDVLFIEPLQPFVFQPFFFVKNNNISIGYSNLYSYQSVFKTLRPPAYFIS